MEREYRVHKCEASRLINRKRTDIRSRGERTATSRTRTVSINQSISPVSWRDWRTAKGEPECFTELGIAAVDKNTASLPFLVRSTLYMHSVQSTPYFKADST